MPAQLSTIWLPLLVLALLLAGSAWWWWRHRQALAQLRTTARASAELTARATAQTTTKTTAQTTAKTANQSGAASAHRSASASMQSATLFDTAATAPCGSQPQAALVLGSVERKAYRLLREAFPRAEVLAHVQLLRFIRLPPREQRDSGLQGAGVLDVDLLLCDGRFRVLAAVDVRTRRDTAASQERSERMALVLLAAGISVHVWHEDALPGVATIRSTITPALVARKAQARAAEASLLQAADAASAPAVVVPVLNLPHLPPALSTLERAALINRVGGV